MKIIISSRANRSCLYVAYLEEFPGICEEGRSTAEAVGNLILLHTEQFDFEIEQMEPSEIT